MPMVNIDTDVYEAVRAVAASERRSIVAQVNVILKSHNAVLAAHQATLDAAQAASEPAKPTPAFGSLKGVRP